MSALDQLDLRGWNGFWLFMCALAAAGDAQAKKDEAQLAEIRELGT